MACAGTGILDSRCPRSSRRHVPSCGNALPRRAVFQRRGHDPGHVQPPEPRREHRGHTHVPDTNANGSGLFISLLWPANETASFHDLGCFWLMVSAGLNYYTMLSIWDNYFATPKEDKPATEPQEDE